MPKYVVLATWTDQGIKNVKDSPKRMEAFFDQVASAGGTILSTFYTMGPYDMVAAMEVPSDDVANQILLSSAKSGNIRTLTLKAWTIEEFSKLAQKL
jgi:uncharacterized protein with GYD domain